MDAKEIEEIVERRVDSKLLSLRNKKNTWVKVLTLGVALLAAGFVLGLIVCENPANAAEEVPQSAIIYAIGVLDFKGDPADFTKTGLPRVRAIARVLGIGLSAAERTAAWEMYKTPEIVHEPVVKYVTECPVVRATSQCSFLVPSAATILSKNYASWSTEARDLRSALSPIVSCLSQ